MRIFGNTPSVNMWRKHYENMADGKLKRSRIRVNTRGGFVNTYNVNKVQAGGGSVSPIKIVSPTEASVEQAKKQIQQAKVQDSKNQQIFSPQKKKTYPQKRKSSAKPKGKKSSTNPPKKKRKVQDIFS